MDWLNGQSSVTIVNLDFGQGSCVGWFLREDGVWLFLKLLL